MLSIVVPVYNVSQFLNKCIESIINQTYSDLEIILVDDGSTDDSGKKCDLFAEKDSRIKVIHKENGGLMSAWKTGVMQAKGEYVGFVDSDDYVDENMFETLFSAARENNADITVCGILREYDTHCEKETFYLKSGVYNRTEIETQIFPIMISNGTMLNRGLSPNRVNKLFKKELLLNNLEFCDERVSLGEDLVTTFACMCDAQKIVIMDNYFPYHYKIRGTSIMGSYNPNFFNQSLLLRNVLSNISLNKRVYDFSLQLTNDFLSLAYYGIERNIASNKPSKKEMIEYINNTVSSVDFKEALKAETLSKSNKKCLIYKVLIKTSLKSILYEFIKRVVIFVRNKKTSMEP